MNIKTTSNLNTQHSLKSAIHVAANDNHHPTPCKQHPLRATANRTTNFPKAKQQKISAKDHSIDKLPMELPLPLSEISNPDNKSRFLSQTRMEALNHEDEERQRKQQISKE